MRVIYTQQAFIGLTILYQPLLEYIFDFQVPCEVLNIFLNKR